MLLRWPTFRLPLPVYISVIVDKRITVEQLSVAIADYIENFHNTARRHSALNMLTPTEFETIHTPQYHHA